MPTPLERLIERANDPKASEDTHQSCFFAHLPRLAQQDPRLTWVHAIPNGGQRDAIEGGKMVATGSRSGVWDISLPFPVAPWPFGYIEMKKPTERRKKNGGLSDQQIRFGKHLISVGAWWGICYSYQEALDALQCYLRGEPWYQT